MWLKALRSRKYKQGKGQLKEETVENKQKYCCLGVLCAEAGIKYSGYAALPPSHYAKGIGLTGDVQDKLIYMNDTEGKKFYQIARWIERHL